MTISSMDDVQDIVFTDEMIRARCDYRDAIEKLCDMISSIWKSIKYFAFDHFHPPSVSFHKWHEPVSWKEESEGLCVFLHGLHGAPWVWHKQLQELDRTPGAFDRFIPDIPHSGDCSLEDAAAPLLPTLLSYIHQHPDKPVCLMGMSNGGRLASWLELQLRKEAPQTPVKVSAIAGMYFGSSMMSWVNRLRISKWFYHQDARDEFPYGNPRARELLKELRAPLPDNIALRDYEFYASTEDLVVRLSSALPDINKNERRWIVHGESHDSIIRAVAQHQIASCTEWLRSFAAIEEQIA